MTEPNKNPLLPPQDAGYEKGDTTGKSVYIGLLLAVVILVVIIIGLSGFYTATQEEMVYQNVLSRKNPRLEEIRAEEQKVLTSYAWIDSTAGIVQIPIERSMELLVAETTNE